ncbi:hypothetical protein ACFLQ2_02785 [archaeon]
MKRIALLAIVTLVVLAGCLETTCCASTAAYMGNEVQQVDVNQKSISSVIIVFGEGDTYTTEQVAFEANREGEQVLFCCVDSPEEKCAGYEFPSSEFDCTPEKVVVKTETQGNIMAYAGSQEQGTRYFLVGIKVVS